MKPTQILQAIVTAGALLVVGSASAREKDPTFTGQVVAKSPTGRTITVQKGEQTRTFHLDEDTDYYTSQRRWRSGSGDFRPGKKVTVEFEKNSLGRKASTVSEGDGYWRRR